MKVTWYDSTDDGHVDNLLFKELHMIVDGEYTQSWLLRKPKSNCGKRVRYDYYFYARREDSGVYHPDEDISAKVLRASTPIAASNIKEAKAIAATLWRMQ